MTRGKGIPVGTKMPVISASLRCRSNSETLAAEFARGASLAGAVFAGGFDALGEAVPATVKRAEEHGMGLAA